MDIIDFKKKDKALYNPKGQPELVTVPPMLFLQIAGEGNPNGAAFSVATEALYSLSYALKMSYMSTFVPDGYFPYVVCPLEGIWDLIDPTIPSTHKDNLKYQLMIRQPEFLTEALFARLIKETMNKKSNPRLSDVQLVTINEGSCCQMLHHGSYDGEPASFQAMEDFCRQRGIQRKSLVHREIYLTDPRKTVVEKRRTILRFQVNV